MIKRIFSLLLALTLVVSLGSTAFASIGNDYVTRIIKSLGENASFDTSNVRPKAVLLYPLTADMFEWNSGTQRGKEAVTTGQLRNVTAAYSSRGGVEVIQKISIVSTTVNGMTTACVKVEFLDEHVGVNEKNFDITLYLKYSLNRVSDSDLNISGAFGNESKSVSADLNYVDIKDGKVLIPTEYIRSIEIGIGDGAVLRARLYEDRKYYGTARDFKSADDDAMIRKYPSIVGIYTLKTVNLSSSEVMIETYDDCYVYDKNGNYLGQTYKWLSYSEKYYVTSKKVNMNGGVVSSSSSQSSSSSASSSASSASSGTAGNAISISSITTLTQKAVNTAKSGGSKTAVVGVKDAKSISANAISSMVKTASNSGMSVKLNADTMSNSSVAGRITLSPTASTKPGADIKLGVYVDESNTGSTKTKFTKWYKNKIEVVSLAHKGSYGMNVEIAAKVKLTNFDKTKLYLYAYDKNANTYTQIKTPNYSIDKNGYLHFTTNVGGEIIISEGVLIKK